MARKHCPNKNHPDYKQLEALVPNMSHIIWDKNNSFGIDKAPNGEPSVLWNELMGVFNDNKAAAATAKSEIYTQAFAELAKTTVIPMDINGEPILTISPDGWVHINGLTLAQVTPEKVISDELMNNVKQEAVLPSPINKVDRDRLDKLAKDRAHLVDEVGKPASRNYLMALKNKSDAALSDIISGLNSRVRALRQYRDPDSADKARVLERELQRYERQREAMEDQSAIIDFIMNSSKETETARKRIEEAHNEFVSTGSFKMSNERLVQLHNDFLGFYTPLINGLATGLLEDGYFNNMAQKDRENIGSLILDLNTSFNQMYTWYSDLASNRFGELLLSYGNAANSPTIKSYVADNLNATTTDISFYTRFIGSIKNVDDEAIRIIHKIVVDLNNKTQRETVDRGAKYLPIASKVNDWQPLYERDSKGKHTGYLIRDLRFGEHEANYKQFEKEIGPAPIMDNKALSEWTKKKNAWHTEHSERRYTPEYYDLFADLSYEARQSRDDIQIEISRLLKSVTDSKGKVNLENLSDEHYAKLEAYYALKRGLGNKYNFDGSEKIGTDLDISKEISKLNKSLQENLSYKPNLAKFDKAVEEKRKSLSTEKFQKWYERNTRTTYTQEFYDMLDKLGRATYGPEYEQVQADKREFLSLFRSNKTPQIDSRRMNPAARAKVRQMDRHLLALRESNRYQVAEKSGKSFEDYAEIKTTDRYRRDKQLALAKGDKAYQSWYVEHHYKGARNIMMPYSYYTYMTPKNIKKYVEVVPSNEFSEVDLESPFVNKNFDDSYGEKYVPKRSKYDNSKEYNKTMLRKKNRDLYKATTDIIQETIDNIQMHHMSRYKLPNISGTMWAQAKAGSNIARGLGNYIKDAATVRNDDIEYRQEDQVITHPDGTRVPLIPIHYVNPLNNPAAISNDLAGIVMKFYNMGVNYKNKREKMPELELMRQQINNRTYVKQKKALKMTHAEAVKASMIKSKEQTKTSARLDKFYEMNIFGERYTPVTVKLPFTERRFNITKALNKFKNYTTLTMLAMSPFVWFKNFNTSAHQNLMEAHGGMYFGQAEYWRAHLEFVKSLGKTTANAGDYSSATKILAMMNYNRVVRKPDAMFSRLNYNRGARFVMNHLWYSGMTAGDYTIKAENMMAVYMAQKFIPGVGFMSRHNFIQNYYKQNRKVGSRRFDNIDSFTLWDVYENDGITVKVKDEYAHVKPFITEALTNKMTNVIQHINGRADGQISDEDKASIHSNALASYTVMLRNFIVQAVDDRILKKKQWNYMTEDWDEAMYVVAFRKLIAQPAIYTKDMLNYLLHNKVMRGRFGTREKPNRHERFQSTAHERYYMRRVAADLIYQQIAYRALMMLIRSWWEEDKYDWTKAATYYASNRTWWEIQNYYNLMDVYSSFKSVSPATGEVDHIYSAIQWLFQDSEKEILYGPYAGWPKWAQQAIKSTPFKNIIEATDPAAKNKYLEGQLK